MVECDQAVVDFLVATEVGKFPPRFWWYRAGSEADSGTGGGGSGLLSVLLFSFLLFSVLSFNFHLSAGTKGSGGKLRNLAG